MRRAESAEPVTGTAAPMAGSGATDVRRTHRSAAAAFDNSMPHERGATMSAPDAWRDAASVDILDTTAFGPIAGPMPVAASEDSAVSAPTPMPDAGAALRTLSAAPPPTAQVGARTTLTVTVDVLVTPDSTPPLSGTVSDPDALVEVTVADVTHEAFNRGDGTWILPNHTLTVPLADGVYDVLASAALPDGTTGTDATANELTIAAGVRILEPLPDVGVPVGAGPLEMAIAGRYLDPVYNAVRFATVMGEIEVLLYTAETPLTVANFLTYVDYGDYDLSFIHRSIADFVIQGGGFTFDDETSSIHYVPTDPPVPNEPGISNQRGTIAMAKIGDDPDSATSQWFFNLADNSANLDNQNGGFTVFGEVLGEDMAVVDAIAALPTYDLFPQYQDHPFTNTPLVDDSYLVTIFTVYPLRVLSFFAESSAPSLVQASVDANGVLHLDFAPNRIGRATVTVYAVSIDERYVADSFEVAVGNELRGNVWLDLDGNGERSAGEPPLVGVTIFADLDGDGQLDAGEPRTITSAGDPWDPDSPLAGSFRFVTLPPGTYAIRQILPPGLTQNVPAVEPMLTVTEYSHFNDIDFGNQGAAAAISGLLWQDADGDGEPDFDEFVISGVLVELYRDDGDGVFSPHDGDLRLGGRLGGVDGLFRFDTLTPGTYWVALNGWSAPLIGHELSAGNDPALVTLDASGTEAELRFGLHPLAEETQTVHVEPGWNLISLPVEPVDPAVTAVFQAAANAAGATLHTESVWTWHGGAAGAVYAKAEILRALVGYWVYASAGFDVDVIGLPPYRRHADLTTGWNLLGPRESVAVPATMPPAYPTAWIWDGRRHHPTATLERGRGHWLHVAQPLRIELEP